MQCIVKTTAESLQSILALLDGVVDVIAFQLQQYLGHRITPLPSPRSSNEWTEQSQQLRKHILDDIAFHGWPQEWVQSAPRFEQVGATESAKGYHLRKFRYEIVPGFSATALLYEPEQIIGRAPAQSSTCLGMEPMGNAAEYEQKRLYQLCQARHYRAQYRMGRIWGVGRQRQ